MPTINPKLQNWARDLAAAFEDPNNKSLLQVMQSSIARQNDVEFRAILTVVLQDLERGMTMSRALAERPDTFDETFITVVRYGEIYGELDETLRRYADNSDEMFRPCGVKRQD